MSIFIDPHSIYQLTNEAGNIYLNGTRVTRVYINSDKVYDLSAYQRVVIMIFDETNREFWWLCEEPVSTNITISTRLTSGTVVTLTILTGEESSPKFSLAGYPSHVKPIRDENGLLILEAYPQFHENYWYIFARDWLAI